jgi:cytochrome P450
MSLTDVSSFPPLVLFAGFETTATTFSWCMWHMARDLALQDRLRKEIHANFTDLQVTSVSELTYEQVWDDDKMGLVGRILNETLRMHPPVATIERTAQKATVVPLLNSDR